MGYGPQTIRCDHATGKLDTRHAVEWPHYRSRLRENPALACHRLETRLSPDCDDAASPAQRTPRETNDTLLRTSLALLGCTTDVCTTDVCTTVLLRDPRDAPQNALTPDMLTTRRRTMASLRALYLLAAMVSTVAAQEPARPEAKPRYALTGTVRDQNHMPLRGARVSLVGTPRTAYADDSGRFRFSLVPPGRYALRIVRIGFNPLLLENVRVSADSDAVRDVQLVPAVPALSQVTITPGAFTLLDATSSSRLSLSREALLTAPQLAEDVFRSLNRLPGLSGSDFSAKIRIRNGGVEEQLFTLDGLELIEPFHLKDFDGALSILDGESIGRISVTTGGFTAASGNRMSGLVEMASATPSAARSRTAIGLSLSNVRARSEGTFGDGKGSWLVSGRRGFLDVLLKLVGEEDPPDPRYSDLFGKVSYQLSGTQTLSVHGLIGTDNLRLNEDNGSRITSSYDNQYVWGTLRSQFGAKVAVSTLASISRLTWKRNVLDVSRYFSVPYDRVRIDDQRALNAIALKQDWTVDLAPSLSAQFGGEFRNEDADYEYLRTQREFGVVGRTVVVLDSSRVAANLAPDGARTSGYASLRVRPHPSLTLEVGGRADRHAWTQQTTISPRTNAAWTIVPGTTLRGAWGFFHQAHTLQDLSVVDGDTAFARAERAEHRVLGIERELGRGFTARAEAYQRLITSPRARFVNIDGSAQTPLPEGEADRVRFAPTSAEVRGIELLTQYDRGGHLRGGASLVFSRATAVIAGRQTPRPFDEPVAATIDLAYRGTRGWTLALSWTAHSGWPIVDPAFAVDTLGPGRFAARRLPSSPYFDQRLSLYQRVDLRATRSWRTARGRVSLWADVFNALNAKNQRGYSYEWALGSPTVVNVFRARDDFLGLLPTLGVSWEF
jgi:Carboxypeptidase regulatory-like domain/TonB-dependent Receptor Plug Domain